MRKRRFMRDKGAGALVNFRGQAHKQEHSSGVEDSAVDDDLPSSSSDDGNHVIPKIVQWNTQVFGSSSRVKTNPQQHAAYATSAAGTPAQNRSGVTSLNAQKSRWKVCVITCQTILRLLACQHALTRCAIDQFLFVIGVCGCRL